MSRVSSRTRWVHMALGLMSTLLVVPAATASADTVIGAAPAPGPLVGHCLGQKATIFGAGTIVGTDSRGCHSSGHAFDYREGGVNDSTHK